MKLYTEEQVKQSLMKHQNSSMFLSDDQIDYLISEITPIVVPTDDEITYQAKNNYINWINVYFEDGAKWMRDKIQGGNK